MAHRLIWVGVGGGNGVSAAFCGAVSKETGLSDRMRKENCKNSNGEQGKQAGLMHFLLCLLLWTLKSSSATDPITKKRQFQWFEPFLT